MKKAKVKALVLDKLNNAPVVLLEIEGTRKILPIWIGACEASIIAMILEQTEFARPLSHDLMLNIIETLEAVPEKVIINKIEDNTFYAKLILKDLTIPPEEHASSFLEFDARPSDCIIIALKSNIPIYVASEIVNTQTIELEESHSSDKEDEAFKRFVENLDINEFRKRLKKDSEQGE
ncbi:bifunctional nuclease family protein [Thermosipho ferrireducens]|uniref:Bifunctional nuclease family protein n=1 Tax=Thermosipho ferrireducens TaxID=2571116 RepID=A0ABX7S9T6_9BACT|nr:bifunctional nuclease family protein [Thermosipho ferrireducens]QTA37995.1 bifunctional nuclease family protein [Thermosipho ferrireducens]